ncbi:hypothetical protein HMI54_011215 [Coelomomyces lativittatus]|nr:hypothetical protein HMI54_011215 [Coelomomyces lativittatus]
MKKFASYLKEVMFTPPNSNASKPDAPSVPSPPPSTPSSASSSTTPSGPTSSFPSTFTSTTSTSASSSAVPSPSPSPSQKPSSGSFPSSPSGSISSTSSFKKVTIGELLDPSIDLNQLTVRQLKYVLHSNCVNVKHALEKSDLIQMLQNLIKEYQKEIRLESKYCKICMEVPSNCVLLECGHMGLCVTCAKQCSECPFCRQTILRVVHTFSP